MKAEEHIQFWLESASHDLEAADSLFTAEKYDWCLFLGHLVLEKTLKAALLQAQGEWIPPKTHNLVKLAERSLLALTEDQRIFLDEVNDFNLAIRYPDYKKAFYLHCTREYATKNFNKIKETYQWLKSRIASKM
jgi:HEPN domain-containing protein